MFDLGWGELIVIGIVALIVIGPKELPTVLRTVGIWIGKVRRMASEFQDQFREAVREAELDELKKKVDDLSSGASSITDFDPVGSIRKEFEGAVGEPPNLGDKPVESAAQADAAQAPTAAETAEPPPAHEPAPAADARKPGDAA